MDSYARLFLWVLGIQTQIFTLAQKLFLPTEPCPLPLGLAFLGNQETLMTHIYMSFRKQPFALQTLLSQNLQLKTTV